MRQSDYITLVRQSNRTLWEALNVLKSLQDEWNALNYSVTLQPGIGENEGIVAADVGAVVFDTTDAIKTLLASGHATNMAKLL